MKFKYVILIGVVCSVIFILVFLNQLILNINKPLNDTDSFYQYFLLESNLSKFSSLDFKNLYETRMFYPLKNTLALGNSQFIQTLLSLPVYLITKNVIVSAHSMVLINFFLTYLMMYLLVFHFTKSSPASIIGGLIFSYNPYVMAQFYFELLTLFWIPLIFLVTEKILAGSKWAGFILPLLFLGSLISSFYYFIFLMITLPFYLGLRGIRRIRGIRWIGVGLVVAVVLGAFYLQPYLEIKNTYHVSRNIENVISHSTRLIDFFSTTKDNKLYGSILGTQASDYTEHSLFPGMVVYTLFLLSLIKFRKKYLPFLVILITVFLFSLGPNFPIYLLFYKFLPFFDSLRAPSRFFMMGFFSLAVLAAFASDKLFGRLGKLGKLGILGVIIFLICLEYQHQIAKPFIITPEIKQAYQWLNHQSQITVVAELPIANELINYPTLSRSYFDDSRYLLYGIYHQKRLINGNAAYNPLERTDLGKSLTINFPTPSKLDQLKKVGIDAIIVHREEYQDLSLGKEVTEKLRSLNVKEIYTTENISVFMLN